MRVGKHRAVRVDHRLFAFDPPLAACQVAGPEPNCHDYDQESRSKPRAGRCPSVRTQRLAEQKFCCAGHSELPVLLDEVFLNRNEPRRQAAFKILQDMTQEQQLFVFTCPPSSPRKLPSTSGPSTSISPRSGRTTTRRWRLASRYQVHRMQGAPNDARLLASVFCLLDGSFGS